MDEAAVVADEFRQMREEGDDVVLHFALDLVDALHIEDGLAAALPDVLGGFLGDDTDFRQRIAGMGLDLEPDAKLCFGGPDGNHFRPRIAGDHGHSLSTAGGMGTV